MNLSKIFREDERNDTMRLTVNLVISLITMIMAAVVINLVIDHKANAIESQQRSAGTDFTLAEAERQLKCMTDNIYWEAAGEPVEGKIAVAQVVMNRVVSPDFPSTPCDVIHQRTKFSSTVVCQFSWLCENNYKHRAKYQEQYEESKAVAKKVMLEGFRLPTLESALYYHADYVNPRWPHDRVAQIGRHIFYIPRNKGRNA